MNRTKEVIKKRNIFFWASTLTWIITTIVMVFSVFKLVGSNPEAVDEATVELLSEQAKTLLLSVSTTAIIGLVASFIIKDKLRTFIWILNVILSAICYGDVGMYIVLGLWLIEEYVLHTLYLHYKNAVQINKEIDLRGC